MTAKKKKDSPNAALDAAMTKLMEDMGKEGDAIISPDIINARARVISVAVSWEKVKHQIKDDDEFDPDNI